MTNNTPHPEHPRPDLERTPWVSLNGPWGFQADPANEGLAGEWWLRHDLAQEILVPYPIGSEFSGQQETDGPVGIYWYLRSFDLPPELNDRCLRLHFGAVDQHARVWLNDVLLPGDHEGGYTPFSYDVTELVRPRGNRLIVRVADRRDMRQVRGKQTWQRTASSIFYPSISGIWQSVWLEAIGPTHLTDLRLTPSVSQSCIHLRAAVARHQAAAVLDCYVTAPDGTPQAPHQIRLNGALASGAIPIRAPVLWSPAAPNLYQIDLVLRTPFGAELDRVHTYAGLRQITIDGSRIWLNGEPLYQKLVLAQGYYPGGLYTPASDEGYRRDVELARALGFNGLRMHQKLEAPRFLYWCDRLGMLVWDELPAAYWPGRETRRQIRQMLPDAIARDANHPSVITWVLFNESWGIHDLNWSAATRNDVVQMVNQAHNLDPSRPVIDNSGFDHLETDIVDIHQYLESPARAERVYDRLLAGKLWRHAFLPGLQYMLQPHKVYKPPLGPGTRYQEQPLFVSEYGGFGYYHTKQERAATPPSLLEQYKAATLAIRRRAQFQGFCYTQLYDTFAEQNGLLTFDRQPKVDVEALRTFNETL